MVRYSMRCLVGGILAAGLGVAAPVVEDGARDVAGRDTAAVQVAQHYYPLRRNLIQPSLPRLAGTAAARLGVAMGASSAAPAPAEDPASGGAVGVGIVRNMQHQAEYVMDVGFDGKNFSMIVDTGSSDTWIVSSSFQCYSRLRRVVPLANCQLGPAFNGKPSGGMIENQHMNITYGSGHYLNGLMAYASVDIAGVVVPKLQISLANAGYWAGDSVSSGILGLGLPGLTTAYTGTDPLRDGPSNEVVYDPFVTAMSNHGVPPVFSLALSRDPTQSFIAFGGVPPNIKTDSYAAAPMKTLSVRGQDDPQYIYYLVEPESIVFNSSLRAGKGAVMPRAVVDSGTTQILVDRQLARDINAMYAPIAQEDPDAGGWFVKCNATAPTLGFQFGGKMFYALPESMILSEIKYPGRPDYCLTAVNESPLPLAILGDAFMQGLNVVFDVSEKKEIRFANRI